MSLKGVRNKKKKKVFIFLTLLFFPQIQPLPLGDSESETSRETIGDSGRGGSEDDVSTSSPINGNSSLYLNQRQKSLLEINLVIRIQDG